MDTSATATATANIDHTTTYPKFLRHLLTIATEGSFSFYAWMTFLTAVALVGANAWSHQVVEGMGVTAIIER